MKLKGCKCYHSSYRIILQFQERYDIEKQFNFAQAYKSTSYGSMFFTTVQHACKVLAGLADQ